MKKFIALTALLLMGATAQAVSIQQNVSDNDAYLLNNKMGAVARSTRLGTKLQGRKGIVRVVYDTAVVDSDGSTSTTLGVHGLGKSLPAAALITRSYLYIKNAFTSTGAAGSSTVQFFCEDENNIKTATDLTTSSADTLVEGQSTGATSAMVKSVAAACEIKAKVAGAALTAGKAIVFVEYNVIE